MPRGMSLIEFVRQVYYAQEKVYLDFVPTDDKFKEVVIEGNFVLQELQKEEDWLWLRTRKIIGYTGVDTKGFLLPEDFYKPSTLFNDGVRLYQHFACKSTPPCGRTGQETDPLLAVTPDYTQCTGECFKRMPFIFVPWVPVGWRNDFAQREMSFVTRPNVQDVTLGATVVDNVFTFSRPLIAPEIDKIVEIDYQRLFEPLHICDDSCVGVHGGTPNYEPGEHWNPCNKLFDISGSGDSEVITPKLIFTEIPDPLYVVIKTAQYHAEGSPPAQGRIMGLQDQAQKILSSMRENNAAATSPEYLDRWTPGFWSVV